MTLFLASLASLAHAQPVTVHDAFGRAVTLAAPPRRIVPIFSSNTEIVTALGLADRIVGIDAYTRYPPQVLDRPAVGGRLGFSVDAIAALRPDLVIVTPARQAAHQLVEPMERIGVPVLVLLTRSVEEILANIRLVARMTGVTARGEEVAMQFADRLARVAARLAAEPAPSTIMITGRLGNGLMLVAREGTYTGDAIVRAGGRFALEGTAMLAQVSPEAILAADPDVLLWAGGARDLAALIAEPGWADLRAVRAGRAHAVNRAELLIPGPRTVDGIEHLAALLHPARTGR
ncbi:ABC transporter substrate-binding protein [Enhydrobacter sp.]|jgi:iron complex transport system substrate-binding protein|uniref:ABC transporter substrate-binding protein n=1 Tax=Enhydrobacter sp. TaxID=1894999 RepID=UPI002637AF8A|nr:ABC transporter substrate-binding protein [Enhydrobacter sp.]WIM09056.1 MAG: Vitamin B12 ABC transporter, substrate-binding protein BtuF [Enhydrobacter sp.]